MYQLSKITNKQLKELNQTVKGQKAIREYELIKENSGNFTENHDIFKDNETTLYQIILKILGDSPTPKTKKTTKSNPAGKLKKISWKVELGINDLYPYGKVYELKTLKGTCSKIGLVLDKATTVFVKGNKDVQARKGELIEFVCSDIEKGKYRQFNIIGNIKDKCIYTAQLYKNGKRREIECKKEDTSKKDQTEVKKDTAPCPPSPCEEKKKAKPKPQQYASEKKQGQALAELVYLYGSDAQLGNADQIITKIMRRKDNRIVLQMNEYKNTRGGAKAVKDTEQFFLFQEKDRKLVKSEMPKDYTLVDAKTEVLKEGEKAKANTLDKVYSKKEEIQLCAEIEKEMLKCKEGACSPEQKAYYQKLMEECSEKAGKQQFFKDLEKQFMRVFNGQKRGESFWQAYNRIKPKTETKKAKVA